MTQHRVRIHSTGAPEVLRYEAAPAALGTPPAGQVRLRQDAAGLNFVDTLFRDGSFSVALPFDMGVEGAGVVEEVGAGVTNVRAGDRVAYFFSFGAYASERMIDAGALIKLPDDIDTELAAAIVTKGLTAWMLARRVHELRPGQVVLVHGAAGGVGSLLARWAVDLGATVIATVGSPGKAALVRAQGIDHVLDANAPDLAAQVRAIAGGGVDVVYEFIGKATFGQSILALRDGGLLVHVGNASGNPAPGFLPALEARQIRYLKPATAQYVNDRASLDLASGELFAAYRKGALGTVAPVRYRLADVAQAHADLAARRIGGPAILVP
ncbi:quinone oxidoreductase [Massilia atriviolacea]|uniref:Quinone oxidoreductase n=1 Tax=Massilia atriviolacea TaxID=2495579 RepID=A0A430HDG3_9BURK|nr:quinone oxidoreductase [Massilia atriviolacea]RSZ55553.1 quinone oxidoreductase [Massilia atriviolacea]